MFYQEEQNNCIDLPDLAENALVHDQESLTGRPERNRHPPIRLIDEIECEKQDHARIALAVDDLDPNPTPMSYKQTAK